jgi:predicted  nucleic acid-binding Zn-ribbon protein
LDEIISKTDSEERELRTLSDAARVHIEERLIKAYDKIRTSYRNGLAVVTVKRDSCGGCFNKIPPQIQLEIAMRKKIIACEHCGRILVDDQILDGERVEIISQD